MGPVTDNPLLDNPRPFTKDEINGVPTTRGVYALFGNQKVIYVQVADNLSNELLEHANSLRGIDSEEIFQFSCQHEFTSTETPERKRDSALEFLARDRGYMPKYTQ